MYVDCKQIDHVTVQSDGSTQLTRRWRLFRVRNIEVAKIASGLSNLFRDIALWEEHDKIMLTLTLDRTQRHSIVLVVQRLY